MKVRFKKTDNACIGSIEIPTMVPGKVVAACVGDDRADALKKASVLAERIATDPVMQALMPPQALPAIRAARALATAAQAGPGPLRSLWGRLRGPGKQRLARALHAEAVDLERAERAVEGGNWVPGYWAGQEGPDGIELGFAPFAILAAKYGPVAAKAMVKAYKARKRRKAAAKAKARAQAAREREPEPEDEQPEDEQPADGQPADNEGAE
jgi:hypothetical protein